MSNEQAPVCCGQPAKWVELTHSSQYWYCTSCKKEVPASSDTLWGINRSDYRTPGVLPNIGGLTTSASAPKFKVGDLIQLAGVTAVSARKIVGLDTVAYEYEVSSFLGQGVDRVPISDIDLYYELVPFANAGSAALTSKFKVGDRVYNPHNFGDILLVVKVDMQSLQYHTSNGQLFHAFSTPYIDGNYELWTPPLAIPPTPKFKVGDMIRDKQPPGSTGAMYTIFSVELHINMYYVSTAGWGTAGIGRPTFYRKSIPVMDGQYELWTSNATP